MKKKIYLAILITFFIAPFTLQKGDDKKKNNRQDNTTIEDSYLFQINKLILPLNNSGVIGSVNINNTIGGMYDNIVFLFSGGFMMSGKNGEQIWSNGVSPSSRVTDYLPGKVGETNDPKARMY